MTVRAPAVHRRRDLPPRVDIYEVGPRDGLQNEPTVLPLSTRVELIQRLAAAGLGTIEATSFVSPKWVPQLADAGELLPLVASLPGVRLPVLVPNLAGLARAQEAGAAAVAVFASATETFAKRNLNRTVDEALEMFVPVVTAARGEGMWVRAYVSMCFGDPWEGRVPLRQVVEVADRLMAMGAVELSLGDTIGVATPGHVRDLIDALGDAGIPTRQVAVHFHDTYGQALANTLAALEAGVTVVDASAGGLGGCPYAGSATGNLATEDLVWLLHGLGIETGVDLEALVATSVWMAEQLGRPSPSRVVQALAGAVGLRDLPSLPRTRGTAGDRRALRPHRGGAGHRRPVRAGRVPVRHRGEDGRHGPVRPAVPRGVRRHGRRLLRPVPGARGAGPGRLVGRHHPRGRRRARGHADLPVRHRGAEAGVAAPTVLRAIARRLRADRARRRQRRRRHPHHRPARRRRVGHQRHQGVHHQLRHRHHRAGDRDGRDGPGRRGRNRDLRHHRAGRHARLHRVEEVLEGRLEGLRHPRAVLRRLPGPGGQPARRSRGGATPSSCRSSTRAGSPSPPSPSGWPRAASTSACATCREREAFGQADRRVPGDPVQAGRHGGPDPRGPAGLLRRGRSGCWPASRSRRRRPSPSSSPPTRRWSTPARPPRSSAATAS